MKGLQRLRAMSGGPARRRHRRGGYVLLMTLVLIALSALLLAGIARYSLRLALEVVSEEDELQRRWGALSCQHSVLLRAEPLFLARDEQARTQKLPAGASRSQIETHVRLGEYDFDLLLADEDAKANLNTAHAEKGELEGRREVQRWLQGGGTSALSIRLRPFRTSRGPEEFLPAYDSWGQVFELDQPVDDNETPAILRDATAGFTCWGSGQLHVHRASDDALRRICRLVLSESETRKLIALRRQRADWRLAEFLATSSVQTDDQEKLERLLSDRSTCHSLWLSISSPSRRWYQLTLRESDLNRRFRTLSFDW